DHRPAQAGHHARGRRLVHATVEPESGGRSALPGHHPGHHARGVRVADIGGARKRRVGRFGRAGVALMLALSLGALARGAAAAEGQMTLAVHITLTPRWLDPGETESAITPFMVLYAIHDALVKPIAGRAPEPVPGGVVVEVVR